VPLLACPAVNQGDPETLLDKPAVAPNDRTSSVDYRCYVLDERHRKVSLRQVEPILCDLCRIAIDGSRLRPRFSRRPTQGQSVIIQQSFRAAALFGLMLAAGCASVGLPSPLSRLENSLVFQPEPYPTGNWYPDGLVFEDAWFESTDGAKLHGWFVPHDRPRAVVLVAHGNAGNVSHRAGWLRRLHDDHQLTVLAFDYRGYGRSEGKPSEQGLIDDARAARRWLAQRTGVAETEIVLLGRSLGGGVAVQLAANDGARGLILESTFTSLPDVGAEHMSWMSPRTVMRNRFNSLEAITHYTGPVLISHGDADTLIPIAHGQALYAAAPGPKRFVTIPGAGHNDAWNAESARALDEFIAALN